MTLDNGERIVAFRLAGFISTLIYVLYVFMAYFPRIFRNIISEELLNIITAVITCVLPAVPFLACDNEIQIYLFFC